MMHMYVLSVHVHVQVQVLYCTYFIVQGLRPRDQ